MNNNLNCICGSPLINTAFTAMKLECINPVCNLSPEFDDSQIKVLIPSDDHKRHLEIAQQEGYWDAVARPGSITTLDTELWLTKAQVLAEARGVFPFVCQHKWTSLPAVQATESSNQSWLFMPDKGEFDITGMYQMEGFRFIRKGVL